MLTHCSTSAFSCPRWFVTFSFGKTKPIESAQPVVAPAGLMHTQTCACTDNHTHRLTAETALWWVGKTDQVVSTKDFGPKQRPLFVGVIIGNDAVATQQQRSVAALSRLVVLFGCCLALPPPTHSYKFSFILDQPLNRSKLALNNHG